MKSLKNNLRLVSLAIMLFACLGIQGCDSGKEAIDDVTGNKSVEQFQKSEKDINKAVDKQSEKLKGLDDETDEKTSEDLFEEEEE
jgi:hypothetical protein